VVYTNNFTWLVAWEDFCIYIEGKDLSIILKVSFIDFSIYVVLHSLH